MAGSRGYVPSDSVVVSCDALTRSSCLNGHGRDREHVIVREFVPIILFLIAGAVRMRGGTKQAVGRRKYFAPRAALPADSAMVW